MRNSYDFFFDVLKVAKILPLILLIFLSAYPAFGASESLPIVDLMPTLFTALGKDGDIDLHAVRGEMKHCYGSLLEELAGSDFYKNDIKLKNYLTDLRTKQQSLSDYDDKIKTNVEATVARFRTALPDFNTDWAVFIVPAFGQYNAKCMMWRNKPTLFIGIDWLLKDETAARVNISVLISHELFHLYQMIFVKELGRRDDLLSAVWREGLASYVSKRLNPDAPLSDIFYSEKLTMVPKKNFAVLCHTDACRSDKNRLKLPFTNTYIFTRMIVRYHRELATCWATS